MVNVSIIPTRISDLADIVSIELKSENESYIFPNSLEHHIKMLDDPDIEHLTLKDRDQVVGFVILAGLYNADKKIEFRRLVIDKKGKGYGRKTIKMIVDYCFNTLKCKKLWLDVFEDNLRARKLYLSEGFIEEKMISYQKNNASRNLVIMTYGN